MTVLRTVLPRRYSPLQANGNDIQSIYLTELSRDFAEVLTGLILWLIYCGEIGAALGQIIKSWQRGR
jgi:hypothetical protein